MNFTTTTHTPITTTPIPTTPTTTTTAHTITTYNHSSTYHDYGTPVVVTLSVFLVTSMVLSLIGNIMVIITILRHPGMRTRTNMLLGNLAVADILVAVLDMPVALITIISRDWVLPDGFCDFNAFAVGLGLMLSVHTLMWISIHKFFSITRPFARNITQFQILLMMLAAWVWTIAYNLTATPLIGMTRTLYKPGSSQCGPAIPEKTLQYIHSSLNTIFNLLIPMIVMSYCYYKIFKEVQTHLERMRDFADVGMRNSLIQQKQITMTLLIVLIVFFLFWLPYILYSTSLVFCGELCVPRIFNPISYLFGYMNSACNPVIYALRSPSFRRGFQEILFGKSTRATGQKKIVEESFRKSIFRQKRRAMRRGGLQPVQADKIKPKPNPEYRATNGRKPLGKRTEETPGEATGDGNTRVRRSVKFTAENKEEDRPYVERRNGQYLQPWVPLEMQAREQCLSGSWQDVNTSTAAVVIRSASANDIPTRVTEGANESGTSKRRHKSEVHQPLMWKASVDHLVVTGGRRGGGRGARRGRGGGGGVRNEQQQQQQQQQQQHTSLAVRTLIRNVRRSLGDLFINEEVEEV